MKDSLEGWIVLTETRRNTGVGDLTSSWESGRSTTDCTEIKGMLRQAGNVKGVVTEPWDPVSETGLSRDIYERYKGELYGILCSLTGGEAKNVLKGVHESGDGGDGFKGIMFLEKRFDAITQASLLHAYLEVVSPSGLKSSELAAGIHKWEMRVGNLQTRYSQTLGGHLKLAIFVGMLPKEFQGLILQNGQTLDKADYAVSRDYVLGIVNQRAQMARPVPMEVGMVGGEWGMKE